MVPIENLRPRVYKNKNLIKFEERVESGHVKYAMKCLSCGVHFAVFTWFKDWFVKVKEKNQIHCPECGNTRVFPLNKEQIPKQIWEVCGPTR